MGPELLNVDLEPLLARQREIYDLPLGRDRFRRYLDVMTAGSGDMELPLALMNPMGKPHVAARLDELIDLGAEEIASEALSEAADRLRRTDLAATLRFGLVVVDDAGGGWTNRYTTEMAHRFGRSAELNRDWIVGLQWTNDSATSEGVRSEVLSAVYRALHRRVHGHATALDSMMLQEGRAAAFAAAGAHSPDPDLAAVRARLEEHLESTAFPVQFSCLYGDAIAEELGYRALGLPAYAGYRVAAEDAACGALTPEAALA